MLIKRSDQNPILKPDIDQSWEARAVFSPCPIKEGKDIFLFYQALSTL